ncbi:MAG: matrixin family metalloprotease [Candidatus Eisenbacteria bacterium]|uniref:Matrixin family metalloprotease n=1 Tax=Eiseniibacteriota bacterium TaxID=2212470 RepID=A0A538SZU8_UNCEI|nr:MAG: matrixin family metalloprotease [Candidatus Eisenbacteria bacterium]
MKSHRIHIALAALGAFVFALTLVSPASAFIRLTRQGTTGIVQAHWLDSALPLSSVINPTNADIPSATALSIVQASAKTWENINTSYFTVNPVEYTGAPGQVPPALDATDGQNSMFFDTAGANFAPGGSVIAFVRSTIDLTDGHTLDADMVYNDRDFFSSTSSPNLTPAPPGQSSVDLQSVVTHEYGHYFGLDHTSVANATMIPFIIGDTRQRTLELDDRAGNSTIYPESAARGLSPGAVDFGASTGTISGTVVSGFDGSAIFGAHVEALVATSPGPATDPLNSISAISGELTVRNGLGEYTIHGLPPGDYHVRIVPLDGIHTIAADPNVGGIFNGLDINFEVEYWNGAGEGANGFTDQANDFTPVTVSAGSNSGGINFITNTFPGRVEVAQYGQFENIVTFRNSGFLVKRFDLPFTPPYTVTKITFPSFTFNAQFGRPPLNATFPSVRLCELNTATGLPNLAAPLFQIAPFVGSPNGINEVPIGITINDPDKVLFWAIQFPPATNPTFPADFPFLRMDFTALERGLFANDYSINSAGTTAATLVDRNITVSLTAQMGSPELSPIVPVANLGANQRLTKFEFSYNNPADKRLDGFALPPNSLNHVNLVRRLPSGLLQTEGTAGGSGHISMRTDTIPAFPAGAQLWFVQAVDNAGNKSLTSNTTITGFNVDADEPNGRGNATEAKALTLPTTNRPETYSPAGDQDYFLINASPGETIQASAVSTGQDSRNDQDLVMFLLDTNGDILAFDDDSNGGLNPKISFTVPPRNGKGTAPRKFFLQVTDIQGSAFLPNGVPQVRIPPTYNLSAKVLAAPALAGRIGGLVGEDGFAFQNSGPNPANPQAKLLYVLPRSGGASYGVKLRIYDVSGRLVRKLVDGSQPAGPHVAVWNGTDDLGRGVASGHYYARIDAGEFSQRVGITILK